MQNAAIFSKETLQKWNSFLKGLHFYVFIYFLIAVQMWNHSNSTKYQDNWTKTASILALHIPYFQVKRGQGREAVIGMCFSGLSVLSDSHKANTQRPVSH